MFDIKEHLKDRKVAFVGAAEGNLWYATELGFEFPVPFDDMGEATFAAEDKAMLFMRYVRKHAAETAPTGYPGARVTDGGTAFLHARAGNLWYRDTDGFEFPVRFADTGGKGFPARGESSYFDAHREAHRALVERERQAQAA